MMTYITKNVTLAELFRDRRFNGMEKFLIYDGPDGRPADDPLLARTIAELKEFGWSSEAMLDGVNFLLDEIHAGRAAQHFVYDASECADDRAKRDVNVIRLLPERIDPQKPWILLAAGGGYGSVCTLVESLPTARHMVAAGYQVFLFTYRVKTAPTLPRALEDLAAAIAFIGRHAGEWKLDPACCGIGGYSAGANLISSWGVPAIGWRRFGLPKPKALFPVYTIIDLKQRAADPQSGRILVSMLGPDYEDTLDAYNVSAHVDAAYPPCYIVVGKDDVQVDPHNSELLRELLDKAGVPAVLDEGAHAPHGFGDGTGTDVEGWPERALAFLEKMVQAGR